MDQALLDSRELQACDLLATAERYQPELLAVAVKLAGGSREGGMDLFQQTVLNCHDAVQRWGFDERRGEYRFYLLRSLRNLHYKECRERQQLLPLSGDETGCSVAVQDEPGEYEVAGRSRKPDWNGALHAASAEAPSQGYHELAEQVAAEARAAFAPDERILLRLHVDGYSCREIADLTGVGLDRRRVWEKLEKLKGYLRREFQQAWQSLGGE